MKTKAIIIAILFAASLNSCHYQEKQIPSDVVNIPNSASEGASMDDLPAITFEETTHDFGKVIQGEVVSFAFRFKNTGKADLVISNVSASCGCTATKYPKLPVQPGEEEVIQVTFDSGGRQGFQHKTVTVAANTQPNTTVVDIKAQVIIPEKD